VNLLLDTHAFLWLMLDSHRISADAIAAIRNPANRVVLSAASSWEMAIKQSIGKLELPGPVVSWVPEACSRSGIELLDLSTSVTLAVAELPWHHRDPFDRALIAQAQQGFTLLTHDRSLLAYGVPMLWV
jgi:PIN domain nuclease of toxin-antitoxin system